MYGQYTHYLLVDTSKIKTRISTRYDWDEIDEPTYPTDSNTKAEISSFMDTWKIDYSSSDTKAELLNGIESAKPVGNTVTKQATLEDMINNNSTYFAKRESPDGKEFVVKTDFTLAELNALGTGFTVYTNEELKTYIADNWDYDE